MLENEKPQEPSGATEAAGEPLVDGEGAPIAPSDIPADVAPQIVKNASIEEFEQTFKDDPRFMRRFMGGKASPEEVWRKFIMRGRRCFGCGSPKGAILIRVFMPLDEAYRRNPDLMTQLTAFAMLNGATSLPTVDLGTPPQPFIRVSERVACDACKATAERAAAHGPSWCVVEIKRGPGEINPLVRVSRSLRR